MRGDHQLNEAKFAAANGGKATRPMQEDEIKQLFRSPAGFLGPDRHRLGKGPERRLPSRSCCSTRLFEGRKNLIAGANKEDYHLKNLTPGKDFQPTALRRPAQRHRG